MFYMKHNGHPVYLGNEPVYDVCPGCGKEHELADFWEHAQAPDFDLYGRSYFCPECASKRSRLDCGAAAYAICPFAKRDKT